MTVEEDRVATQANMEEDGGRHDKRTKTIYRQTNEGIRKRWSEAEEKDR